MNRPGRVRVSRFEEKLGAGEALEWGRQRGEALEIKLLAGRVKVFKAEKCANTADVVVVKASADKVKAFKVEKWAGAAKLCVAAEEWAGSAASISTTVIRWWF